METPHKNASLSVYWCSTIALRQRNCRDKNSPLYLGDRPVDGLCSWTSGRVWSFRLSCVTSTTLYVGSGQMVEFLPFCRKSSIHHDTYRSGSLVRICHQVDPFHLLPCAGDSPISCSGPCAEERAFSIQNAVFYCTVLPPQIIYMTKLLILKILLIINYQLLLFIIHYYYHY